MNIQPREVHRFSELLIRNRYQIFGRSCGFEVYIELSYFILGNIELGFQLQEMKSQRETGGPKCDCMLEINWLSYDSEVKLITLLPGKKSHYIIYRQIPNGPALSIICEFNKVSVDQLQFGFFSIPS